MLESKAHIISQLQKDILPLQGIKASPRDRAVNLRLGSMRFAFPNAQFPLGAIHEFLCGEPEMLSASSGFISGLLSSLMRSGGVTLWISSSRTLFPPALKAFGIEPDKIIFIDLQKEKDVLWTIEEGLKCNGLAAVVGEVQQLSFTASRRLQLAVENSRVTGFICRKNIKQINTTACVTRWKITSIASALEDGMPGIGFPRWNVELLKVRNGKPGSWRMEWRAGRFCHIPTFVSIPQEQKKTG
jgi:protein ImuA